MEIVPLRRKVAEFLNPFCIQESCLSQFFSISIRNTTRHPAPPYWVSYSLNHHHLFWTVSQDTGICPVIGVSWTNTWKLELPNQDEVIVWLLSSIAVNLIIRLFLVIITKMQRLWGSKMPVLYEEKLNVRYIWTSQAFDTWFLTTDKEETEIPILSFH